MSSELCILITLYCESQKELIRCALKIDRDKLPDDFVQYPMELQNRAALKELLPLHVRTAGPIVEVDVSLFEVTVLS